jgi:hypothetical protein
LTIKRAAVVAVDEAEVVVGVEAGNEIIAIIV